MRPLWECDTHRLAEGMSLSVFMGVVVNPADQRRIRAAIEREVREAVALEIEAVADGLDPNEDDWPDDPNDAWAASGLRRAATIARGGAS